MISLPEGASGKALALLIAVLMIGTIHFMAVAPLFSYYESTAQKLQDRQQLARRHQNLVRDLPRLRAEATRRLGQSPGADLLLAGPSDAVASAMLQSALKELVELERGKLTSAEMLPPESVDEVVHRVGVRIAFSGDLKLLTSVIKGIETTRPLLLIGNLDIHGASALKAEDGNGALAVAMDVFGFLPQ